MNNILPISEEKHGKQKDAWWEAIDDIMLMSTNLKVAIEVAFQNQGADRDFDHWIMDKIREESVALDKVAHDAHDSAMGK